MEVGEEETVEGAIARTLMVLSSPLVVQTLSHVAQSIIDVFWLGQFSPDAVAAAGLVLPAVSVGRLRRRHRAWVRRRRRVLGVAVSNVLATLGGVVYYRYSTTRGMLLYAADVATGTGAAGD